VNQGVQGVRSPWSLSGSLAIVFNPPTWCGAAKTLCAGGRGDPLPLSGEVP
jgi:hypothetical protein